jgi:succinate dehydrogenase / fumarate reductase cytochrome b subunit
VEAALRSWPRRLHSISGVVPVGAFLAFHLYVNTAASRGADAYNAAALRLQRFPLSLVLEIVLIFVPLAYHGVYGLFVAATVPASAERPARRDRILAILQRVTGILLFAFILFHLWTTRLIQIRDHESLDLFRLVQAALANPWIHAFYAAGIVSATFHLSTGFWSFSETWGLAASRPSRTAVALLAVALFVVLTTLGLRSVAAFRL